jgi:TolB-like protein/DNA-binding winged helix-turn-helix (wHTH) protein/Flp pilus assembly protein TadD
MPPPTTLRLIRFGCFELDAKSGEICQNGLKTKLQEQPFQVLLMLLERAGDVVSREELKERLWPEHTFVDFDQAINKAVNKIRQVLSDSAESPRYIETLPKHGYRFIYPLDEGAHGNAATTGGFRRGIPRSWRVATLVVAALALLALLGGLNIDSLGERLLKVRWGESQIAAMPRGRITSIAVLPLQNLSGDPEQEYFADGMTEALITDLSKVHSLKVISRTSVMQFKGVNKPLREIARQLHVQGVVEGSVLRASNRVRITVQLVHAATDTHLWAETYDRDLGDILALQSDVAESITNQVEASLTPQEERRVTSKGPVNPQAYDAYLKGRYLLAAAAYDEERTAKARAQFEQAIELDPSYAQSYVGLAFSYYLLSNVWVSPKVVMPRAKAAARKALELDENLGEAYAVKALVLSQYDWDWAAAEKAFRRAIDLNPSSELSHQWYGVFLVVMGKLREAEVELNRAEELDPLSDTIPSLAIEPLYFMRRYGEAEARLQGIVQVKPELPWAHFFLGWAYEATGRCEQAVKEYDTGRRLGELPYWVAVEIGCFRRLGMNEAARKALAQLEKEEGSAYVSHSTLAVAHLNFGDKERALDLLGKAYEEREEDLVWIKNDPRWDPLRTDPRFQDLLHRMNFPP